MPEYIGAGMRDPIPDRDPSVPDNLEQFLLDCEKRIQQYHNEIQEHDEVITARQRRRDQLHELCAVTEAGMQQAQKLMNRPQEAEGPSYS